MCVSSRIFDAIVERRRASREGTATEIGAKWERAGDGQPRLYTAAVIRDFTAAARAAGSETSYVCAGTNFLA